MSDLSPTWGFLGGTSRGSPGSNSAANEEEPSIINYAEPALRTVTSDAGKSSDLSDTFRVLSDIHFQEPSLPLVENTKDDILFMKNNLEIVEHGEPSTSTRKIEEPEQHNRSNELSTEPKKEKEAKKTRRSEMHNMSERRRRRRIKEKVKTLQQLIPNSNKRDCASILDEAIQYLKTLKDQAAPTQMMPVSMSPVYCNPYISAIVIPNMPVAQYPPYVPLRPGMSLVPLVQIPSPSLGSSRILPISRTNILPDLQRTNTVIPTLQLEYTSKEGTSVKDLEKDACGSQEGSASDQFFSKPSPGSIVHATLVVPPATEESE